MPNQTTLENFIRDHLELGNNELMLTAELDKNSGKVTAIFEDIDGEGSTAHVRIEGNTIYIQSFADAEGKPIAPSVSEAIASEAETEEGQ